jgi:hypothetical protein
MIATLMMAQTPSSNASMALSPSPIRVETSAFTAPPTRALSGIRGSRSRRFMSGGIGNENQSHRLMVKNMKPAMMATTITRVAIPMVSSFDAGRLVRSLGAPFLSISLNIPRHVGHLPGAFPRILGKHVTEITKELLGKIKKS